MRTLVAACDSTTNQLLSQEPSLGSDFGDDGELDDEEGLDADVELSGQIYDQDGDELLEPDEALCFFDLLLSLRESRKEAAILTAEIAAVGRGLVRKDQAAPPVKRDLSHLDLAPGWSLTRLRDSFRADALRAERVLAARFTSDAQRATVHRLCTEVEWLQRIVLDGASYVDVRGWDYVARVLTDELEKDSRSVNATEAAAAAACKEPIKPYVRPASCAREPLCWRSPANVRARAAAAAAAEADVGVIGGGGSSGNVGGKESRASFSNGARCVPETDYSDSDHDSGTEGGGVEEDPELVSEEEEDMDEFSADPSQW